MANDTNDQMTTLYLTLAALLGEVPRLREAMAHGPLDEVIENHDKLIATLMSIRTVAGSLAELESDNYDRAITLMLLESEMTAEILRLTHVAAKAAGAGL